MAEDDDPAQLHVLTLAAVKAGIEMLQSQRIHEQFPAYLHLRQRGLAAGSLNNIEPIWHDVSELLWVPGGPPTKPHYRPFASRNLRDPSRYWLNENLAGSYAPSSLRSTFMLNQDGAFALPPDHARQALRVLLKGSRVPAWALAAYYLRNYGFTFEGDGTCTDLIDAFKEQFLLDQGTDFDILFDGTEPSSSPNQWFEPVDNAAEEEPEDA